MNPLVEENARLRQRVEELEELLRYETEEKAPAPKRVCAALDLLPSEYVLAECIAKASPRVARHSSLTRLLKRRDPVDPMNSMQGKIHQIRRVLRRSGITIETDWGNGYFMTKENAARFFEIVRKAQFGEDPVEVEHA